MVRFTSKVRMLLIGATALFGVGLAPRAAHAGDCATLLAPKIKALQAPNTSWDYVITRTNIAPDDSGETLYAHGRVTLGFGFIVDWSDDNRSLIHSRQFYGSQPFNAQQPDAVQLSLSPTGQLWFWDNGNLIASGVQLNCLNDSVVTGLVQDTLGPASIGTGVYTFSFVGSIHHQDPI